MHILDWPAYNISRKKKKHLKKLIKPGGYKMNNLKGQYVINNQGKQYKVKDVNTLFELILMVECYRCDRKKRYKVITLNQFNKNYQKF